MEPWSEPNDTAWPFPFPPQDWEHTPPAVQAYLRTVHDSLEQLHDRVESLEARLKQHSTTSSRPPSSDSPYKKTRRHTASTPSRKAGGKPGHPGHRQELFAPTSVHAVHPERCACGSMTCALRTPY
jgi:transposase